MPLDLLQHGQRFDLILLDVAMPGLNGIATAALIRSQWPKQLLLFITRYYPRGEWGSLGADEYRLHKPFRQAELTEAVQKILEARPKG